MHEKSIQTYLIPSFLGSARCFWIAVSCAPSTSAILGLIQRCEIVRISLTCLPLQASAKEIVTCTNIEGLSRLRS